MMTEQETKDFGAQIVARLKTEEALEAIAADVDAQMATVDGAHFQAWTCTLVEGGGERTPTYRLRLQRLNQRLIERPAFFAAMERYHVTRVAQQVILLVAAGKFEQANQCQHPWRRTLAAGTPAHTQYQDTLARGEADATDPRVKAQLRALLDDWSR